MAMTAPDSEHECELCRVDSPDSERAKSFFAAVDRDEEERHEAWMDSFWTLPTSGAVSAQYPRECPTCNAAPRQPCRTLRTGRVTDTHVARLR